MSVYRISHRTCLPAGRYRLLPCIISAIILSLSFSTLNLSYLAWIGFIPLFFALDGRDVKDSFLLSYLCGFLFFLFSMYWLINVTLVGWIISSLYQGLYFGAFGLLFSKRFMLSGSRFRSYLILPGAWSILEYLRSHIGGGIGWNLLAYSQYENLPIIQIADITGAYGVSFLILLVNFSIFSVIKKGDRHLLLTKKVSVPFLAFLAVCLIMVSLLFYGYKKIESLTAPSEPERSIKASIIQGNIKQLYKWDTAYKAYILAQYRELTIEAARDNPDIIIWPETSVPGYLNKDARLMRHVKELAKQVNIPILVGAPLITAKNSRDAGDYNSALLYSKKGTLIRQYNKLHLVLFGEFIPLSRHFQWLYRILPFTGKFISGSEYTVFQLRGQPDFSVLICFEDIFPGLVRQFVKRGAGFMVNMTNDAWFGKTCAAYQHASNSVFRAVENRRPFVRSANTGLSCFIDRIGRIHAKVETKGEDIFIAGYKTSVITVYPDSSFTFYTRFGDIFVLFCFVVMIIFLIDYIRLRKYNI
jgi:apolipoprotein N-acyltransferase